MFPDIAYGQSSGWNPTIVGACIALIASLIGSSIGALTTYLVAKQREKSEIATESRKHLHEHRRATQMIRMEFLNARALANIEIEAKKYTSIGVDVSTGAWKDYCHFLAPVMNNDDWCTLCIAAMSAEHVIKSRDGALKNDSNAVDAPLSDVGVEGLKEDLKLLSDGLDVLQRFDDITVEIGKRQSRNDFHIAKQRH